MDDLPVCKRCCFCLPLRHGLLVWGYFKLVAACLVTVLLSLTTLILKEYLGAHIITVSIVLAVLITDNALHILFIIGGHKKSVKLLRIYYYYSLVMYVLTVLLTIVCTGFMIASFYGNDVVSIILLTVNVVSSLISIIMQSYFLFLLRSEIIKLRSNCPYRFVKNVDDSEDTVKEEKVVADGETRAGYVYEKETS